MSNLEKRRDAKEMRKNENSSEPSVSVLTAEVRVLQIGTRQVTQSIARQLDPVNAWEMIPMGRIALERSERWVDVIGKDRETSALVIARVCRPANSDSHKLQCPALDSAENLRSGWMDLCNCGAEMRWKKANALELITLAGLR